MIFFIKPSMFDDTHYHMCASFIPRKDPSRSLEKTFACHFRHYIYFSLVEQRIENPRITSSNLVPGIEKRIYRIGIDANYS